MQFASLLDTTPTPVDTQALTQAIASFALIASLLGLLVLIFTIYLYWRICSKAGYGGAMSLLILIPGVGSLVLLLILAFGSWPIHQQTQTMAPQNVYPPQGPYTQQGPYPPQYPQNPPQYPQNPPRY